MHCRASTGPPGRWRRRGEDGELYYSLEFTVRSANFFRHNLSVYASRWGPALPNQVYGFPCWTKSLPMQYLPVLSRGVRRSKACLPGQGKHSS